MTMMSLSYETWVQRARSVPIEEEITRRHIKLKRSGAERIGPCPRCAGDDRFSINPRKGVFNCRGCGHGGDVIELSGWTNDNTQPRKWAVYERIPLEQPTLFSGEGAIGKSTIELQLCAAHVLANLGLAHCDWLGMLPEPGGSFYFGCEDMTEEIHRRLADIARFYRVEISDLLKGGFHYINRAGEDALLGEATKGGKVIPTPLYNSCWKWRATSNRSISGSIPAPTCSVARRSIVPKCASLSACCAR
jgi:hypothetical protein